MTVLVASFESESSAAAGVPDPGPPWDAVSRYLAREFTAIIDPSGSVNCEILFDLSDGGEASHVVWVWQEPENAGTVTIDSPVRDDVSIDGRGALGLSAALRFGVVASDDGMLVVRHRVFLRGLTPEVLELSVFGVALDAFQLSDACATLRPADPGPAFDHLFT